jgi:hypothetical protein
VLFTGLAWAGTPLLVCGQYTVAGTTRSMSQMAANKVIVESVEKGSPASRAGMQKGDQISSPPAQRGQDDQPITPECSLGDVTQKSAVKPLTIQYWHVTADCSRSTTTLLSREGS